MPSALCIVLSSAAIAAFPIVSAAARAQSVDTTLITFANDSSVPVSSILLRQTVAGQVREFSVGSIDARSQRAESLPISTETGDCFVDVTVTMPLSREIKRAGVNICRDRKLVVVEDRALTQAERQVELADAQLRATIAAAQGRMATYAPSSIPSAQFNPFRNASSPEARASFGAEIQASLARSQDRLIASRTMLTQENARRGEFYTGGPAPVGPATFASSTPEVAAGLFTVAADDPRMVEFLFATNRSRPVAHATTTFGSGRTNSLTLGAVQVRIPEHHETGRIELPWRGFNLFGYRLFATALDPKKHFVIKSVITLNRARWLELASASSGAGALVFVHGYRTSFDEAAYRMAQIIYDMQYRGVAVLFSWPSDGGFLQYLHDRDSALGARQRFMDLLHLLQVEAGIQRVDVLAHSMGNLVVVDALANYAATNSPRRIGELIMAAPDVDRDQFRASVAALQQVTEGMTLYASSADKAISLARDLAGGVPRAGDVFGGRPIAAPGVDVIDVTAMGEEMLGVNHSVFAETRVLIGDIKMLVARRLRPPSERAPYIREVPADGPDQPAFWRFAR